MVEESSIQWAQHLETVWRRRREVLIVALVCSVAVLAWIWFTAPEYRAHATIMLGAQRVSTPRTDAMSDKAIQSELAMLSSPALLREVLDELRTAPPAGVAPVKAGERGSSLGALYRRARGMPPADPLDEEVRDAAKHIDANRVEEANVVEVSYRDGNPRWAAAFVNTLLQKHIERIARLNEQPGTRVFYQGQRDVVYRRLEAARDALNRFHEKEGSDLAPSDDVELHKALAQLDSERASAESQLAEARARVGYLSGEIHRRPAKIASESEMRQSEGVKLLEGRLATLEIQRSEAITKYTTTSTPVRDLDAQIAETRKLLSSQAVEQTTGTKTAINPTYQAVEIELVQRQAEAAALAARVQALSGEQARLRGQISRLANLAPELERLQNEEKSANDAYLEYLKRGEEARLTTALDQSGLVNISLLERAKVPDSPEPTKDGYKLLFGVFASFLAGAAVALVRERLDPLVNSGAQAQRMTGVPVIESIPG